MSERSEFRLRNRKGPNVQRQARSGGAGAAQPRRLAPGDGGLTRASGARPSGRLRRSPALRAVVLTFDKTKVSRANSAEALFFAASRGRARQANKASAELSPAARASPFLKDQKGTKKSLRRTRSAAIQPRRAPALLGQQGTLSPTVTQPKLAALRHGPALRPCRPAMLGSLYGSNIKSRRARAKANSNGNGNGNGALRGLLLDALPRFEGPS